jgi:hypothetical protein
MLYMTYTKIDFYLKEIAMPCHHFGSQMLASHIKSRVLSWMTSLWDSLWTEWQWRRFLSKSIQFSPANQHSTIAPLIYYHLFGCVTAHTRHHFTTSLFLKFRTLFLTQQWLIQEYRWKEGRTNKETDLIDNINGINRQTLCYSVNS